MQPECGNDTGSMDRGLPRLKSMTNGITCPWSRRDFKVSSDLLRNGLHQVYFPKIAWMDNTPDVSQDMWMELNRRSVALRPYDHTQSLGMMIIMIILIISLNGFLVHQQKSGLIYLKHVWHKDTPIDVLTHHINNVRWIYRFNHVCMACIQNVYVISLV